MVLCHRRSIETLGGSYMSDLVPLMNDTKWEELRLAMYALGTPRPRWRIRNIGSGYVCNWDTEWLYHFRVGGYRGTEWVEIAFSSPTQRDAVLSALAKVHVPGEVFDDFVRVYGYAAPGVALSYIGAPSN